MPDMLTVVGHPLILHKLTHMRRKDTSTEMFRRRLGEIAQLLAYEVTRDLPLEFVPIETPLATMKAPHISGKKLCLVSILRAGNGMLDGMLEILHAARVGHVGLYGNPATLVPVEDYFKVAEAIGDRRRDRHVGGDQPVADAGNLQGLLFCHQCSPLTAAESDSIDRNSASPITAATAATANPA